LDKYRRTDDGEATTDSKRTYEMDGPIEESTLFGYELEGVVDLSICQAYEKQSACIDQLVDVEV
jgi:hypothetical protein